MSIERRLVHLDFHTSEQQIKEVCEKYDADGIFLDTVSERPCYGNTCINTFVTRLIISVTQGNDWIYISWEIFKEYATQGSLVLKRIFEYALEL